MQSSFDPSAISSSQITPVQYEDSRLVPLWRNWLDVAGSTPLDKWLKNTLRPAAKSDSRPQPGYDAVDRAVLSLAMFSALRFQQLASALEFAYRNQATEINWQEWDLAWHQRDLQATAPVAFWYWIQLRVNGDSVKKNQAQLRDAEDRRAFFNRVMVQINPDNVPLYLLWYGLRPQWSELLNKRKELSDWSDQTLHAFIQQQVITPPLWLRAQKNSDVKILCEQLQQQGVNASVDEQQRLVANGGTGINSTVEYKQGLIEIQDLASQQIALSVIVKPGQKVWDACAGAGGKTLAIGARMNNKGALVATDLHAYKLDELKRRVKRADIFNVRAFTWDGTEPLRLPKEIAQQKGFDWVMLDAPCSSAGTWRRNPDARWRFDADDTQELILLQRQLLTNVAPAVRENGHLVYATCSWQVSENEQQVDWFLQQFPQFSLQSRRLIGTPELDSDTMFVAVLMRNS